MKLLLVEDDLAIGEGLRLGLQGAGCRVHWVRRGADALDALATGPFDAVVLDLGLPDQDGLDLLGRLGTEARPRPPVLILSARSLTQDKITALHRGADDYLTKPFDFDELLARLVALHRRARGQQLASLQFGPLAIDPLRRDVHLHGRRVELTPREFDLLLALAERPGVVRSLDWLHERLYGWESTPVSNAIQVHLHHLRRKLGTDWVQNVRGVGYRFRPESDGA
ncbi:MAG: response regulator transcription factor [Tepidimonas fonticaldi]|nr:response regulator transcription factor [Tepidimonas fonticaldi]